MESKGETMIIAGLGQAGKEIAKLFKPHKQYRIISLDEGEGLEHQTSVEDYDAQPVKINKRGLKKHEKGILFVCGSGKVAGATLRVLEALTDIEMDVFYIVPDLEFCSREQQRRHRVHFNVLQEYARSGKIKNIILASNKELLRVAGAGPISRYYEKVNFYIYNLIQNILYCKHTKAEFGQIQKPKEISRITTFGFGDMESEGENLLFPLDNITETCYLYNIDEEDIDNDPNIMPQIQQMIRDNKTQGRETSYAIWKASDYNLFYSIHHTHFIQEDK